VTIPLTVTGGATSGTDYTAAPATVTIAAGQLTAAISLGIAHDTVAEADETIVVEVDASPTVGTGGGSVTRDTDAADQRATVTIPANDGLTITIARKAGESGAIAEASGSASFTVTVTGTSAAAVSVPFTVDGTNITADDYNITAPLVDHDGDPMTMAQDPAASATGGTLTIAAGTNMSGEITVQATQDTAIEGAETLTVNLTTANIESRRAGTITVTAGGSATATVDITDDDAPTITASATTTAITEGGNAVVTIAASGPAHVQPVSVTAVVGIDSNTATADATITGGNSDFGSFSTATIPVGMTTATLNIPIADDSLNEATETFTVTIRATTRASSGGPTINANIMGSPLTFTITDDDGIDVTITRAGASPVTEAGGATVNFTVALSGGTRTTDVIVPFTVAGANITDTDYNITGPGTAPPPARPRTPSLSPRAPRRPPRRPSSSMCSTTR